jgi:hypothetical protein
MNRTELETVAAFNLDMHSAAIRQASDSQLLDALRHWLGAGPEVQDSDVLDLMTDDDWCMAMN